MLECWVPGELFFIVHYFTGYFGVPIWHGPDFTCNFPQTALRPTEIVQSQIYPKILLCFDSHLLANISRCSSQHLRVISSKPGLSGTENSDFTRPQSQKCQMGTANNKILYQTVIVKLDGRSFKCLRANANST